MPSPKLALLAKEWRELMASRAWWVMLAAMGPLAGMSFISAVTAYGELSSNAAGVGEAFSPLIGIWAPTFSACELAAAFLLPFVGIRLVSGDKQSGALKIELQHPLSSFTRLSIKSGVLLCGWLIATGAPLIGVALWMSYGGDVYAPELATVMAGHVLNGALTIALAVAAAALTEHPATAAIVTLTITVGTWLITFAAAVNGGWWERAAAFTPTAMVAEFQRGLLRADVSIVAVWLTFAGLVVASIWLSLGEPFRQRIQRTVFMAAITFTVLMSAGRISASWDASESRRNSFTAAQVEALRSVTGDLHIVAHFAPEDPRRSDLEHNAFRKLRRAVPAANIEYRSATSTGLFEQTSEHYGEIEYSLGGHATSSRVTTAEGVLETVFTLAGISPPAETDEDIFRGHPLAARPNGAAAIFYGAWPAAVAAIAFIVQRRKS